MNENGGKSPLGNIIRRGLSCERATNPPGIGESEWWSPLGYLGAVRDWLKTGEKAPTLTTH